jgi:hypothetical protein
MHDLIRLYAAELGRDAARDDQSEAALGRLLEHYRDTACAADGHLRALPGQAVPERFDGRVDALAWLDAERPTLVAAVTLAAASGRTRTAVSLASHLAVFLDWQRRFDDMITTGQAAVDSARHAGDRHGEAGALDNLGLALREVRRSEKTLYGFVSAGSGLSSDLGVGCGPKSVGRGLRARARASSRAWNSKRNELGKDIQHGADSFRYS